MSQIKMSGYGNIVHFDDSGNQTETGICNTINAKGIERIITADTALKNQSYVFHYILLTTGLPRDRTQFTKSELTSYGARYLPINKTTPSVNLSSDSTKLYIDFESLPTDNDIIESTVCDTMSLAYTDGLGNIIVCTYAEYVNPETGLADTFVVPAGGKTLATYRINLSIVSNSDNIPLTFVKQLPMTLGTTLSDEYVTTDLDDLYTVSARLPYVDGSNKLKFSVEKNTNASWNCYLVTGLFVLNYKENGNVVNPDNSIGISRIVEIEFILPEEAESKLNYIAAMPTGISQTISIRDTTDETGKIVDFLADPLSSVDFYLGDVLISKCITDANGYGVSVFANSYNDPITDTSRKLNDGLLLTVKTTNSIGTFTQDYIPIDNVANSISHWNWIDNTHLKVVGRLNDVVKIYIDYGYTNTGETLTQVEVGTVTLTTPDSRYGYDSAYGIIELNIFQQYPIYYTSRVKVNVTDQAGNVNEWNDVLISQDGLNLSNLFELARPSVGIKNFELGESLFHIPLITKGSKA